MDENYRLHFPIMETPILHVFHSFHEVRQGSQQSSLRQEDDLCRHETRYSSKFFFFQIAHQLPTRVVAPTIHKGPRLTRPASLPLILVQDS